MEPPCSSSPPPPTCSSVQFLNKGAPGSIPTYKQAGTSSSRILSTPFAELFLEVPERLTKEQKGLTSRPTLVMRAASSLSFLRVSLYIAAFLGLFIVEIKGTFLASSGSGQLDIARLEGVNMRTFALEMVFSWSSLLPPIISDAIVIWRAWVLYTDRRWVLIGPDTPSSVRSSGAVTPFTDKPTRKRHNPFNIHLFAAIVLSFTTNLWATVLILVKLRRFQGSFNLAPWHSHKRTRAQKNMVILVDSGLIYCGFQLIFVALVCRPFTRLSTMNAVYSVLFPIYLVFIHGHVSVHCGCAGGA
ncbi:hypothetical protein LshimejAT787_0701400 [Lyophyllum shimeji]|uniref:Uncharacterized protein n=1 Tax=Lyophyllum shimeji TaxID=47721 RepID=A0A9P3PNF0_LYOSH|nr:hypothetical protein LshimejAT787_0701400 [Lyophyllum shimeji]